ncbi:Gfo/Idh/MocA family protein [Egicoccus halophilus]|uniref:Dehydrogenase n=1 Tax=Egicoccus halophilus TaxID=1670830 RepID=A0A8J3EQV6_9ACTN|nr:Gfo/Idh/MocA family oxidoreductase [Egicoccus halophilus]GGI03473.1 dehydrogenase [Egicoccus halophilus]
MNQPLGVGIVGSGFIGNFHVQSWVGVRGADIVAVQSRNEATAKQLAERCRQLGVGDPTTTDDLVELVRDPRVQAIWVTAPNHVRVEMIERICEEVASGRAELVGIAIEKPLARTLAEARRVVDAIEGAGILGGYLENQVFAPGLTRSKEIVWTRGAALAGSPYLARASEEHAGPHRSWFWNGTEQGGGVLSDMMCHSVEAGRFLLTPPGEDANTWLTPISVSASIAGLKWTRPAYADRLAAEYDQQVDYRNHPSEDYAHAVVHLENGDGELVVIEATTSWSYVGAGLRLSFELLGPEYSMQVNTLDTPAKLFLSRELQGEQGEDLVEKQNAEQGLMPLLEDEAVTYGYTDENRHMVTSFRAGTTPRENVRDGLVITELMMAAYLSAESGETIELDGVDLSDFVPQVAQGTWDPRTAGRRRR